MTEPFDPERHRRRSIRLRGYDYTRAGAYFVTVCVYQRASLFGEVADGEVRLYAEGRIVHDEWLRTASIRPRCTLDAFVVMPNHIHGIIILADSGVDTPRRTPPKEQFGQPTLDSMPTIIRLFKSAVTKRINDDRGTPSGPVWQRGYFEHVIRDDVGLDRIRQYIANNPARWSEDPENPAAARR